MDPYQNQTALLKAMAHPVRLRILEILGHGDACVCHLTAILGQRQPYVSQQLMNLREAKLVVDRRQGNIVYYELADQRISQAIQITRQVLWSVEGPSDFTPVQRPPVPDCTCPLCDQAHERILQEAEATTS